MALGDPYATAAELKTRLRITDSADDTMLSAAVDVASRGIESLTGRQFNNASTASARVFRPRAATWASVDDFYTTTDLVVATDESGDGTFETTWLASEYELWPLNGVVDGQTGWPYSTIRAATGARRFGPSLCDRLRLRVTARWGWAAVPSPVKEATLILAEDLFKLRDTPFGAGGYGEYGRIRARQNPEVWLRVCPYVRTAVLVA